MAGPYPTICAMPAELLLIERFENGIHGQSVLCLKGPLTIETFPSFQSAVRNEGASTVILDLTDVPYIDSSGLGSLVSAYVSRQKAGQRVVLSGVNERILLLMEITRVEPLFLIFPTLDNAIDSLTGAGRA
jgi:anti-sigma B factor antagonist